MRKFLIRLRSWFKKRADPTEVVLQKSHRRRHLPIAVHQQKTSYDCTPTVLRMVHDYFSEKRLSHAKAMRLTRCDRNGAELRSISKAMSALCGLRSKKLHSLESIREAIRKGSPVVTHDMRSYRDDHACLIVGETKAGFYLTDPNTAKIRWRSEGWLKQVANEFIAIFPSARQATSLSKKPR